METLANIVGMNSLVYVDDYDGDDFSFGEVLSVSSRHGKNSRIIDSSATFHMCLQKN